MRITGGTLGGRPLVAPKGQATRPTTDRVRESLFNILAHGADLPPLEGGRVIDLFAGSGALGFEAISRGAVFCLFVEIAAGARGAIRDNQEALGLTGITRIHRRSAISLGNRPSGMGAPFTHAFLDPPYGEGLAPLALSALRGGGWLAPGALVAAEQRKDEPDLGAEGYDPVEVRVFGDTRFTLLTHTG